MTEAMVQENDLLHLGKGRNAWKNISVTYLLGVTYFLVMSKYPGVVPLYIQAADGWLKFLVRLLLLPFFGSMLIIINNMSLKSLALRDKADDIYYGLPLVMFNSFTLRFLQTSMSSYTAMITVSMLVSLQEVMTRFTVLLRHRLVSKYFLRLSDDEIRSKHHDPIFLRAHGRVTLTHMIVEYISILVAPLVLLLYRHATLVIRGGYNDIDGSLDVELLGWNVLLNLSLEIVTDAICWRYEDPLMELKYCWIQITSNGQVIRKFIPRVLVCLFYASFATLFCLYIPPFNGNCDMVRQCIPFPCKCYPGSSTFDPNITLEYPLPPFFTNACSMLSNNQSETLLRYPIFEATQHCNSNWCGLT